MLSGIVTTSDWARKRENININIKVQKISPNMKENEASKNFHIIWRTYFYPNYLGLTLNDHGITRISEVCTAFWLHENHITWKRGYLDIRRLIQKLEVLDSQCQTYKTNMYWQLVLSGWACRILLRLTCTALLCKLCECYNVSALWGCICTHQQTCHNM